MKRVVGLIASLTLLAAACAGDVATTTAPDGVASPTVAAGPQGTTPSLPGTLRLLTHDSFLVSDEVFAAFTAETGISVEVIPAGDTGIMVNQAVLTAGNPFADVLYGIDNTFLSRALDANLFVPHESPGLATVPAALQIESGHHVTPIDYGDVCVNFDKAAFTTMPAPGTLGDLADPRYAGMLVVENPATSSPGLAFLLATIAAFPESAPYTWRDFWRDLRANDVLVTSGWEEAYYGGFSGGSGEGDRPLVVSYASSPPVEVIFSETPLDEAPTGVLTAGCFRQIEFAGILRGTPREEAARLLIDFMLSERFQEDIPLNMFVFPANADADLPPEFVEHTTAPTDPATLDPALIEAERERWIDEWTSIVLR